MSRARALGSPAQLAAIIAALAPSLARAAPEGPESEAPVAYLSESSAERSSSFWWPTVVLERASTHIVGARSLDETRFGLGVAYRTQSLSPHVRVLISPSFDVYENLALMAGAGLRVHFEVSGVPLSCGVGVSVEARLRDSLWLAYATPLELGVPLYRGKSAEHYLFIGARHSLAGALINSYLLDPNGYANENALVELDHLRDTGAWQVYLALAFGRRVE
jgi:hypothetical protein